MKTLASCIAAPALLHVGHGQTEWTGTWFHWLLEPVHLPLTLLGVAVLATAAWLLRRRAVRLARRS